MVGGIIWMVELYGWCCYMDDGVIWMVLLYGW